MRVRQIAGLLAVVGALALTAAACGGAGAEPSTPGDIPDNQAFVAYTSSQGGYKVEAPEGWARNESGAGVMFSDKLNGESVVLTQTASAPTAATARTTEVAAIERSGRGVQIVSVKDVSLPSGPAVLVQYTSDSESDSVTGKQVRLENESYLVYKDGKLATLSLWAPKGADNVDQWLRIAQSFRWS